MSEMARTNGVAYPAFMKADAYQEYLGVIEGSPEPASRAGFGDSLRCLPTLLDGDLSAMSTPRCSISSPYRKENEDGSEEILYILVACECDDEFGAIFSILIDEDRTGKTPCPSCEGAGWFEDSTLCQTCLGDQELKDPALYLTECELRGNFAYTTAGDDVRELCDCWQKRDPRTRLPRCPECCDKAYLRYPESDGVFGDEQYPCGGRRRVD